MSREAAGEGSHLKIIWFGTPHPVLRTTLSLWERDLLWTFFQIEDKEAK
jgi:hypothetical protein